MVTAFFISMLLSAVFVVLGCSCACKLGMLDHPDVHRKHHHVPVPMIGGLAMYIAFLVSLSLNSHWSFLTHSNLLVVLGMIMLLGLLDDKYHISVSKRFLIQISLVAFLIEDAGGKIEHLGVWFGEEEVFLPSSMIIPFSIFAFVGAINATNMIDGSDGMAGSMIAITLLGVIAILFAVPSLANTISIEFPVVLLGVVVGFLAFNSRIFLQRAKVFMGDAGSMWLGLALAWLLAIISQASHSPWAVAWLFGLPLVDTIAVMLRRIRRKKSPFVADRTHIHHLLERKGFTVGQAVGISSLIQFFYVTVGVCMYMLNSPDIINFTLFAMLFALYYHVLKRVG